METSTARNVYLLNLFKFGYKGNLYFIIVLYAFDQGSATPVLEWCYPFPITFESNEWLLTRGLINKVY